MPVRIIISDNVLIGHPENIRAGILDEYPELGESAISIQDAGFAADLAYALLIGASAIVRSISDLNSCIAIAQNKYQNGIQAFFAFLSNTHSEQLVPTDIPNIITVGAGILANETAYGAGLEFWDEDLDLVEPELSSFANGRVAGKLLKIKDALGCSWWEARYRARMTASHKGAWDKYNGYGKINVDAAIARTDAIIVDPYYDHNPVESMQFAGFKFQ
jgi:hypothetical protein